MKLFQKLVRIAFVALGCILVQRSAVADVIVSPVAATTEGTHFGNTGVNGAFTEQLLYQGTDLTGLNVGDVITGYRMRLDISETAAAPTTAQTWNRLDIWMGVGNPVLTSTFANNFASAPTTVRSGSIVFPALAFPTDGGPTGPHSFGYEVVFDTPYVYTGGPLLIEFRTQTGPEEVALDLLGPSQTNAMFALGAGGDNATEAGTILNQFGYAMMLSTSPVPEPGSTVVLLLGSVAGLGVYRRRRTQAAADSADV